MRFQSILGLAVGMFLMGSPVTAFADAKVKVGSLRCDVSAGIGFIITSSKRLHCSFTSVHGYREHYYGKINKFGIDIGETKRGVLVWEVFAPTSGTPRRALAGEYGGVDASATIGVGGGANVLLGGFDRSIALQPISLEGQRGFALAAGVESLTLHAGE